MKLKTADIVPVICSLASVHVHKRFDSDEDYGDESPFDAASNKKLWKRVRKVKLGVLLKEMAVDIKDVVDAGWEFVDTLNSESLSPDCVCRHFVNTILNDGLDPLVITDPTDTKILLVCWHSD